MYLTSTTKDTLRRLQTVSVMEKKEFTQGIPCFQNIIQFHGAHINKYKFICANKKSTVLPAPIFTELICA